MRISKVLLETIAPIAITTFIIIGYFFVEQTFFTEPGLICETYHLSNITYLTYALILIVFSSFYQILIGNFILQLNKNVFVTILLNSLAFSIFFIGILILINLYHRKIEWDFYIIIFLILFILGLLFTVVIKLWRKLFFPDSTHL
ncbi:hypothetical protein BSF42_21590 [Flavobacterium sp. ACN6]|nr:hypothetical protein BSF42_21590 [Flavobacterium sp. ACN6]